MSINANELRIGNWVRVISSNRNLIVEDVGQDGINIQRYHDLTDFELKYKDIEPISLSEEILIKCGFEKFSEIGLLKCFALKIDDYNELLITIGQQHPFIEFGDWQKQDDTFQYLHQLQNLYFALTGQEFEIKL